jgi:hypothetical protein
MCGGDGSTRDRCMAENVDWLLDRAGPDARMALWAHNGHISRVGYGMGSAMGTHLSRRHGADVVSCGLLFGAGTYTAWKSKGDVGAFGTSPAAPARSNGPSAAPASRAWQWTCAGPNEAHPPRAGVWEPADMRSIGAMAMDDAFTSGVPGEHYDVLFYVQDSTPSVLLDVETPSSWGHVGLDGLPAWWTCAGASPPPASARACQTRRTLSTMYAAMARPGRLRRRKSARRSPGPHLIPPETRRAT